MSREGQTRVEIRKGVFIWMDANDKAAFEQRQKGSEAPISLPKAAPETASIEPSENASQPPAKAKK